MNGYTVKAISYEDTKPFLLKKHYAHRMPSISFAYGLFKEDTNKLVGVCTYGTPASRSLVIGIAGEEYSSNVIELNRLYLDDEVSQTVSNTTSWFVSKTLKDMKQYNKIIVSYADEGMNHVGYIYQATNFMYTGKTKPRTDRYTGRGKHSRHYDKKAKQIYRVFRSAKYRYVYLAGTTKRDIKNFKKALKYPVLTPYPKGGKPEPHYKVGDNKPELLKEVATGNIIKR